MKPRFVYYQPKQVLLTATQWDHINIYPTEESYIQAFRELAKLAHDNSGFILSALNGQNNNTIRAYFKSLGGKNFTYAVNQTESNLVDYSGQIIKYDKDKTTFKVFCKNKDLGTFTTLLMGDHNIENCVGAIGMSHLLGLDMKSVNDAVATFKGLKVHLELVGKTEKGSEIFSDLAHSAVKAKSTLEALRTRYKTEKIVAIFDPHASSLSERKSLDWYPGTFDLASEVIIPHVSVKKSTPKDQRVYGTDIVNAIKQTQQNAKYMPLDESIVEYLLNCDENTVIVFMSSGSWRGIIEKIVK
jgi:UDP-N-acetylmuramate-alanine ligase